VTDTTEDPQTQRRGGFPRFSPADPGPGFGRFVTAMRRAQDLAVSADPDPDTWEIAADRVEELNALLTPYEADEGVGPAARVPDLPGGGSLLMPPFRLRRFDADGVEVAVQFSRYHVGGNSAVFGMVIHATARPISRTAYLHVDYRNVTPIDVGLTVRGWASNVEGRKTFVNSALTDADGKVLAEAHGLMVSLKPGQP
jgi:hypothetical protein